MSHQKRTYPNHLAFWLIIIAAIILAIIILSVSTVYETQNENLQATLSAAPAETSDALEFLYQKGIGYINIGQWHDAQEALQIVFEINPNYKDVQIHLRDINTEIAVSETTTAKPTEVSRNPVADNSSDENVHEQHQDTNGGTYNVNLTKDRFGNPNTAYNFNGIDNHIDLGSNLIDNNIFSFSVWFKTDSDKYAQTIIGNYVSCSYSKNGFSLLYYGTEVENGPRLQLTNGGKDDSIIVSTSMADDQWHHFVGMYEVDGFSAYLDNKFIGKQSGNYAPTRIPLLVGTATVSPSHPNCAYGNGSYFNGAIDDIQIYNYQLSTEEIMNLYEENRG